MTPAATRAGWAFVAPALGLLVVFFVLPTAAALVLGFSDFDVYTVADPARLRFVGLANYARLLDDPRFWTALRNTVWFVAVAGPLSIIWDYTWGKQRVNTAQTLKNTIQNR